MIGCGSGSAGGGGQNPPPPPAFTTIDAVGAGTASGYGTWATHINSTGDVVGYYVDANGVYHGFIDISGSITSIDAPGAGSALNLGTLVGQINASGEAAGYYADSNDLLHSFLRTSEGTLTQFDPPNSIGSDAFCINDSGIVAGGLLDANGSHGFVRGADGSFAIIDPTGDASQVKSVFPVEINESGAIAGYYADTNSVYHGFLRDSNGTITLLDAPGAGTAADSGTEIADMNASGVIVGAIAVGGGITHGLMRSADGTYTVFDPPQAVSSFAEGINDNGVIVGEYRKSDLVRHGYLLQTDGTFTTFDDPNAAQLPSTSVNIGTATRHINLSDTIVGYYSDSAGVRHGFTYQPSAN